MKKSLQSLFGGNRNPKAGKRVARLGVECLEARALMAASLSGGLLTVAGDNNGFIHDAITLRRTAPNSNQIEVQITGTATRTFNLNDIGRIQVNGGEGNDTLTVDSSNGAIDVASNYIGTDVDYDGGAGVNKLVLQGGTALSAEYYVRSGSGAGGTQHIFDTEYPDEIQKVSFRNLTTAGEGVLDLVNSPSLRVVGTDSGNTLRLDNGTSDTDGRLRVTGQTSTLVQTTVNGQPALLLRTDFASPLQFANKGALILDGDSGFFFNGEGPAVNLGAPDTIVLAATEVAAGLTAVTVNGSLGADTIRVEAASVATTVNGGADNDTIQVGLPGAALADRIRAALTLRNTVGELEAQLTGVVAGSDRLTVDDSGDAAGRSGSLSSNTLSGLGLGGAITYSGLSEVNVLLGRGNDTFRVTSTAAGVSTTVNAGAGSDTVTVGTNATAFAAPVLSFIRGGLTLDGGAGAAADVDTLTIDDSGDTTDNQGVNLGNLTRDTLSGLGLGATINYSGFDGLNILLGSGNDFFRVRSTAAGTHTTVRTGAGADTIAVGSIGDRLDFLDGLLTIDGGASAAGTSDRLILTDTGDNDRSGSASFNAATGVGLVSGLGSAGIEFTRVEAVEVHPGTGLGDFLNNAGALVTVL